MLSISTPEVDLIAANVPVVGLSVTAEDMGGPWPRRLFYFPDSGKVLLKRMPRAASTKVATAERDYVQRIDDKPVEGTVDLF